MLAYLTFNSISLKSLSDSDTKIRSDVRQWLRLPKDSPVAFFQWWHSPGPMRMSFCLMLWKITAQFFANTESLEVKKPWNNWNKKPQRVYMTRSMDTDFRFFSQGTGISDWIMDGRSRMPSSEYIQCIKVRAAVLPNNLRISSLRCHHRLWHSPIRRSAHIQSVKVWRQRRSNIHYKQQSRWIPSSSGLCDCIRLQLERSNLIEIVLLLARPHLLQKHVFFLYLADLLSAFCIPMGCEGTF